MFFPLAPRDHQKGSATDARGNARILLSRLLVCGRSARISADLWHDGFPEQLFATDARRDARMLPCRLPVGCGSGGISADLWHCRAYQKVLTRMYAARGELAQGRPAKQKPALSGGLSLTLRGYYRESKCRRSLVALLRTEPSNTRSPTRTTTPPRISGSIR